MGQESSRRIWDREGAHSFTSDDLQGIVREIDMRLNGANVYTDLTRTSGLITNISYYAEALRTTLIMQRNITYAGGLIIIIESIYYNADNSEDCRITETVVRNIDGNVTECDSVFTTTEDTGCD